MRKIRLNESQFNRLVSKCVKKVLKEGSDKEGEENLRVLGKVLGLDKPKPKKLWNGVPNSEYIWHGEWSDPEIRYNGSSFNYYDVYDWMWNDYEADCDEEGCEPTDDGFDVWLGKKSVDYFQSILDELDWAKNGED